MASSLPRTQFAEGELGVVWQRQFALLTYAGGNQSASAPLSRQ
jgi:hypothetical protein